MFARVVQVQIHLSGVGMRELADLQIDDNEALQLSAKKQQVDLVPCRTDAQSLLSGNEGEIVTHLKQQFFDLPDQRVLQVRLFVFALQP